MAKAQPKPKKLEEGDLQITVNFLFPNHHRGGAPRSSQNQIAPMKHGRVPSGFVQEVNEGFESSDQEFGERKVISVKEIK